MTHDSIDIDGHAGAEALLGERLLDAWVPSAIASVGEACNVLRAEPVEGQSKVLVYVVRPPEGVTFADIKRQWRSEVRQPISPIFELRSRQSQTPQCQLTTLQIAISS